jgi:hypothetical protein
MDFSQNEVACSDATGKGSKGIIGAPIEASTIISHSGPSDRSLRSISAVHPQLFFFTERRSVSFCTGCFSG